MGSVCTRHPLCFSAHQDLYEIAGLQRFALHVYSCFLSWMMHLWVCVLRQHCLPNAAGRYEARLGSRSLKQKLIFGISPLEKQSRKKKKANNGAQLNMWNVSWIFMPPSLALWWYLYLKCFFFSFLWSRSECVSLIQESVMLTSMQKKIHPTALTPFWLRGCKVTLTLIGPKENYGFHFPDQTSDSLPHLAASELSMLSLSWCWHPGSSCDFEDPEAGYPVCIGHPASSVLLGPLPMEPMLLCFILLTNDRRETAKRFAS